LYAGVGRFFCGCARADAGDLEASIAEMAQVSVGIGAPGVLVLFAERLRRVGRHDDALGIVALGLMRGESQGAHWGDAVEEAEARLLQSLEIARREGFEMQDLQDAGALLSELA
jgi:hypothetical protein